MRLATLLTLSTAAMAGQWTGYISDAACGWNNARNSKEAKECARVCVKGGWDPVLVPDGSMNTVKFANKAKALPFVGEKVHIRGSMKKDLLTIEAIKLAK